MAPYPESESMAIKRLTVALNKRNWELFDQGIKKIEEMFLTGQNWIDTVGWQELTNLAESDYIPPNLWEKFSKLATDILKSIDSRADETTLPAYKTEQNRTNGLYNNQIAIFYNQVTEPIYSASIKKHRVTLNNLMYNNTKYTPEPKWFEDLTRLINNLDKPNTELTGFLSLISMCKNPGTIVTSSYDSNIIKNFVKSNIEFFIPDIKISANQENSWEILPLGGLSCCYICTNCKHRTMKTGFTNRTIVGSCSRCSNASYPDVYDISEEKPEVNPKIWYQSFNKLCQSKIWVLINPPAYNEQPTIRELIKDAALLSKTEEIFIVSPGNEVGKWWKTVLGKMLPDAVIKSDYPGITSLLNDFENSIVKVEETEEIETTDFSGIIEENQTETISQF